jgi:hypothetical protein
MTKRKQQSGKISEHAKEAKRDRDGRFMGVRIADPPVKPRGTTVREIRRAVAAVLGRRSA